jgi:hypothetical protein
MTTPTPANPALLSDTRRHPEHTGLNHFGMIERDFDRASRDTGDVPTRITPMVKAYYYEDLLDKWAAQAAELQALRERVEAMAPHADWLRCVAEEARGPRIRKHGWANTCERAADAIDNAIASNAAIAKYAEGV